MRALPFSLAAAAVLAVVGLGGCEPIEEDPAPSEVPDPVAMEYDAATNDRVLAQCSCEVASAPDRSLDECIDERSGQTYLPGATRSCLEQGLSRYPEATPGVECMAQVQRDFIECIDREGCRAPFFCDDGEQVPVAWVCDTIPDCTNEEDEPADCAAPFQCGNGATLSPNAVCNGTAECVDGSDEPPSCTPDCNTAYEQAMAACPETPDAFHRFVVDLCSADVPPCTVQGC